MAFNDDYLVMTQPGTSKAPARWALFTDTAFASVLAGFITTASDRGMRVGDLVEVFSDATDVTTIQLARSTAAKWRTLRVSAISSGAATLVAVSTS